MKIECKIKSIGEHKSAQNATTGNTWHRLPIEVTWTEQRQGKDCSFYNVEHSLVVELRGDNAKDFSLNVGQSVTMDIHFSTYEWNGKILNNVRSSFIILR